MSRTSPTYPDGCWLPERWDWKDAEHAHQFCTHWMPLPEPPAQEKADEAE